MGKYIEPIPEKMDMSAFNQSNSLISFLRLPYQE